MELDDAPFGLEQVMEEATELLAERAHAKGLELICKVPPGMHTAYRGDAMRLRQVLINLLGNAVKFTEQGHVIVRVRELADGDGDRPLLRFEVEDTGIGIRPENHATIFESFSQEDGSTTRRFGGTGLGLAICRQLVELMGGKIGLQSKPGQGSTFWFTVPLARETAPSADLRPEALEGSRILVVDDNATNREILREQLQSWHVEVTEAATGPQALERMQTAAGAGKAFDLVVLDYQMPGMNGMDVVRAARATPTLQDVSVVLLSSMSRISEDTDWRAQRVAACLTKPVRRSQLHTCLARLLSGAPSDTIVTRALDLSKFEPAASLALKVLLVEDNPVNQAVARGMLDQLGCQVTVADNGHQGVAAFQSGQFDVVLMDCQMPELDGYGATQRIREWERTEGRNRTPVVALTANALEGDREKCLAAGMDEYLTKPFTMEQLRRALGPQIPVQGSTQPTATAVLDEQALVQLRQLQQPGGPDLVSKVIGIYLDSSRSLTEKLRTALTAGDASGVREAAHALKSSSANVGATALAELARRLEMMGREASLDGAMPLLEQMLGEYQRVVGALQNQRAAA